jgi:PKD repeat protein
MSLPLNDRQEYVVSSIGIEFKPQSVIVKGSLWTLQSVYSRLLLKDYQGYNTVIEILAREYVLTPALNTDLSINTNLFWLWVVNDSNQLCLYEVEPFASAPPSITCLKSNIASNAVNVSVFVQAQDTVRIVVLYNDSTLKVTSYPNIKTDPTVVVEELPWEASRLKNFSNFVTPNKTQLDLAFANVLSPPNIYLDSYIIIPPTNFSIAQVGSTNEIQLSWDTSVDSDAYIIDRDTNPAFPSPTSITTTGSSYSDFLSTVGTYYYRIRGVNYGLFLQSEWSGTENVTLTLIAEFSGTPLDFYLGNTVVFTDLSTPTGLITSWDWDFGDGSPHSTEQNPTYQYPNPGTYTVTLTVYNGSTFDTNIKEAYVVVRPSLFVDFVGEPLSGDADLTVQFTDISLGQPTSWDWDFGDGSPHSTEQNPIHVYARAGLYSVTLTAANALVSDSETKTDYITVNMVADFSADETVGPADLTVHFTDMSIGQPTSWDWDFGDGSPHSTEQNPTHVYTVTGRYTVTLIAANSFDSDIEIKTDYITVNMVADFYAQNNTGLIDLTVLFFDLSIGQPTSWDWDFGDGSPHSTEQNPIHVYTEAGNFTVTLTVARGSLSATVSKIRYVNAYDLYVPPPEIPPAGGFTRIKGPTLIFD